MHFVVCSTGLPLNILTGLRSQHDSHEFIKVMEGIRIEVERGRPRTKPGDIVADAAYDITKIREYLRRRNIRSNIGINKCNQKKSKLGRPTRFEK